MTDVEDAIFETIAKKAKVNPAEISRDKELSTLVLDSLDIVEIIFEIEEKFDIAIPYNANESNSAAGVSFKTVGDVADFVRKTIDDLGEKG